MSVSYGGSSITFEDGSIVSSGSAGFKNKIINGAMMIDQRNAGASVSITAANQYTLDRWQAYDTQASKFSIQQNAGSVTPTAGFTNYLGATSSSAYSILATDVFGIAQYIEGYNVSDLAWGTASAATVTLSFKVYSSLTGTFGGSLQNNAGNRTYPFSYTISSANTWTTVSITISGDTTGTWLTTNGTGIRLLFGLGVGSTYSGTAGAWTSSTVYSVTGATSVVGTSGATFYITGVQLEKGTTASSFEFRSYQKELVLCQRYLWVYSGAYAYARGPVLNVGTTSTIWYFQYPTTMRAAPSLTLNNITSSTIEFANYTNGAAPTYSSAVFNESSIWGGCITLITTGSTFTIGGVGNWRWTGAPSANFTFSAEI
jgi:hypothetical protein